MQDESLRLVLVELVLRWFDEERLREEGVPRRIGNDAEAEATRGVCAGERVDDVDVGLVEVRDEPVAEPVEARLLDRVVDVSPADPIL